MTKVTMAQWSGGGDVMCRKCNSAPETTTHIVSGCPEMNFRHHKGRHDKLCAVIHWGICKQIGVPGTAERWWQHVPQKVVKHDGHELIWDPFIEPIKPTKAKHPDIEWKQPNKIIIIEASCPADHNVMTMYAHKESKYNDIRDSEAQKYKKRVRVLPIVIGATGAVPTATVQNLAELKCAELERISWIQKLVALETIRIVKRVL